MGEYWPVLTSAWRVKAIGMEGSGTVGIMKARQARSDAATNAMLRKDKAGEERLGEVGCGLQRQDAAG